ncbi:MAG: tetratricopeptide repeat protein [Betaproteobacteria bacterium]|nr:tetratricopeptide repeat protein [Betaproteobacteria bacterium]
MFIIKSILRPRVVATLALSTVLGAFSAGVHAENTTLPPSDIITRDAEIAMQFFHQQNFTEALNYYERAISRSARVNGEQHRDTARYKNDIGVVYLEMEKYAQARDILMQAARIAGKLPNELNSATIYRNLGATFFNLGDYEKAVNWHQKALSVREGIPDAENSDIAGAYGDIAVVFKGLGSTLDWCLKAWMTQKHEIGAGHLKEGKYAKARDVLTQAAKIADMASNSKDPESIEIAAMVYGSLGLAHYRLGDNTKALEWHRKALAIRESVLGKGHPGTAVAYVNVAVAEARLGNHEKALENLQEAVPTFEKSNSDRQSDAGIVYTNISWVYSSMRDYDNAEEWARKALEANEKNFGTDHPSAGMSHASIATTYLNRCRCDKAVPGQCQLDKAGSDQCQFDKAVDSYLQAYRICRAGLGEANPQTKSIRANLEKAYKLAHQKIKNPTPFNNWLKESLAHAGAGI